MQHNRAGSIYIFLCSVHHFSHFKLELPQPKEVKKQNILSEDVLKCGRRVGLVLPS